MTDADCGVPHARSMTHLACCMLSQHCVRAIQKQMEGLQGAVFGRQSGGVRTLLLLWQSHSNCVPSILIPSLRAPLPCHAVSSILGKPVHVFLLCCLAQCVCIRGFVPTVCQHDPSCLLACVRSRGMTLLSLSAKAPLTASNATSS